MRWISALLAMIAIACGPTQAPPAEPRPVPLLARLEAAHDQDGALVGASAARATLVIAFASWCVHCKDELAVIAAVRATHPQLRVLGVNYKAHEEYAQRGSSAAVRAYVAASAPWLRVVPIGDELYRALGKPPFVPTLWLFDGAGALVARYDRRERALPDAAELGAVLARLGA